MGTTTTGSQKQEVTPWSGMLPYVNQLFGNVGGISQTPLEYFPGSGVAARQPAEIMAQERGMQRGIEGSPLLRTGQETLRATAAGEFLSPDTNPYLQQTFRAGADEVTRAYQTSVLPALDSRFGGAGRGGMVRDPSSGILRPASGAFGNAENRANRELGSSLNELAARIFGGAYQQERGLQMQASSLAPQASQADYGEIAAFRGVGETDRNYQQALVEDARARFEFGQEEPWKRANRYSDILSQFGNYSSTSTKTKSKTVDPSAITGSVLGGIGSIGGAIALSSRALKDVYDDVDPEDALRRLRELTIFRWMYKGSISQDEMMHVGPMAEDWRDATGLGNGKEIAIVDAIGLLIAANNALAARIEMLESRHGDPTSEAA